TPGARVPAKPSGNPTAGRIRPGGRANLLHRRASEGYPTAMDRIVPALGMVLVVLGLGVFAGCVTAAALHRFWGYDSFTEAMALSAIGGLVIAAAGFWIRRRTDPLR